MYGNANNVNLTVSWKFLSTCVTREKFSSQLLSTLLILLLFSCPGECVVLAMQVRVAFFSLAS